MTDKELMDKAIELVGHDKVINWFDPTFIESIYENNKFNLDIGWIPLTEKQLISVNNILEMLTEKIGDEI